MHLAPGSKGKLPILLTRPEAAATLRVTLRTLDTLLAAGQLHSVRIRGRRLTLAEALAELARTGTPGPLAEAANV